MALVPHKIVALAQSDAEGTGGQNIVAGASVSLFDSGGAAVFLYDDENGSNPSTAKTTDSNGVRVVWVTPGEYDEAVNGSTLRKITVGGRTASEVDTFANLQLYRPVNTGQTFICQERGGARYVLQAAGYSAKTGDVTFANGRVGALQVGSAAKLEAFSSLSDAAGRAAADGVGYVSTSATSLTVSTVTDMQGVGIMGTGTVINDTTNLLNVGPLKNCIVRGSVTDYDHIAPVGVSGGKKTKAILRETSQQAHVFTKKAGKGYMKFSHFYNSFTSGPTDTGVACENWRSTITKNASDVYLLKRTADDETGGAWGAFTNATFSTTFPAGTVDGRNLQFRSTNTLNAEIAWNFESDRIGQVGYVAVYRSTGSATAVELSINGVLQDTFSAQIGAGNDILLVKYESTLKGTNEVRLKKTSSGSLNVFGAEFTTLSEAESFRSYDYLAYGEWPEEYVSGSSASDYAIFLKSSQQWFGSIHGGETERVPAEVYVDGDEYVMPAVGDFLVGESIRIDQKTQLNNTPDQLDVDSAYHYEMDSVQRFEVSMSGSAVAEIAYTTMSPTNEAFSRIEFPVKIDVQTGKNLMGRYNQVTQVNRSNPAYPLRLTTYMTLFDMGGDLGANMTSNGPYVSGVPGTYNKLYYGPVTDSEVTITKLGFSNVKVFE